jgi:hypothetical protein
MNEHSSRPHSKDKIPKIKGPSNTTNSDKTHSIGNKHA